MRVCFLAQNSGIGGAERHMAELARHWSDPEELEILTLESGLAGAIPSSITGKILWALRLLPRLRKTLSSFDVIVAFLWVPAVTAALAMWGMRRKPRLIWSVQSDLARDFERHRDGRLRRWLAAWVLPRRVDHCVVVSRGLGRKLLEWMPSLRGKVSIIPNGIDIARVGRADPPVRAGPPGPAPVSVITVGRLHFAKGMGVLIEALSLLPVPVESSIVGDGPERAPLMKLAADLRVPVRFEGFQSNPYASIADADIFVSPSRWETFGVAIVEAMALGTPVIATATDGAREIITDGQDGLLVEPENPAALADAITRLAADPELRAKLAQRARATAEAFDARAVTRRYESTVHARKIERVITRLNIGGPALQAILLTRDLPAWGYRTTLLSGVCEASDGDMSYALDSGDPVEWIPEMSRSVSPWRNLRALIRLWRILRRERPDIVHTHTAMAGCLGRAAALLAGVPVIVHTFHGNSLTGYFSKPVSRMFLAIERFLAKRTDAICAVSPQQREELSQRFRVAPAGKMHVVPLGLDLAPFLQLAPPPSDGTLRVAWFGRLVEVKDIPLLIRVIDLACRSIAGVEFHIAGDGPERDAVREASDRWRGRVVWHGWQKDTLPVLRQCHALIQTSRNEGTPVALIQGMAAGRPFISTAAGGVVDLTSGPARHWGGGCRWYGNAVLAEADPGAFVHALQELAAHPGQLAEMSRAARAFAAERHSKQSLLANLDSLYRGLLEDTRQEGRAARLRRPETGQAKAVGVGAGVEGGGKLL